MSEKGILLAWLEEALAKTADKLCKLKGALEAFDGTFFLYSFRALDNWLGDKVPEPFKSEIRNTLGEIYFEKDYDKAIARGTDLIDNALNIPGINDVSEKLIFKGMITTVVGFLALANINADEDL